MKVAVLRRQGVIALVAALGLLGCGGDDPATFEQTSASEQATTDAADPNDGTSGDSATDVASTEPSGSDEASDDVVEPAVGRTVEVDESFSVSEERAAFTVTVHRLVINDYHVEAEVTIVNDGVDRLETWYGSSRTSSPRLYDDRGREYLFQTQPGGDGERLYLEGGEGVDAVLVFAGRVGEDASELTLDLQEIQRSSLWSQILIDVPVGVQS